MLISEIFRSIQGEGELAGVPSLFIRTSGCNLRCGWCDTPYASWNPEGRRMSVSEIVADAARWPSPHVVLTGGEPMIVPDLADLASELKKLGKHITIETAATCLPNGITCDLASLSPKLSNSAPDDRLNASWRQKHEETRLQPDVIRAWIDQYPFQLKFVLRDPADLDEMEQLLESLSRQVPPGKVLLMPEGVSHEALAEKTAWLTKVCNARGYRFCPRLQIELFGNRRGT